MIPSLESEMKSMHGTTARGFVAALLVFAFSFVSVTLVHARSDKARSNLTFKSHSSVCGKPISDSVLMIKDGKFRYESHVASGAASVDIYDCPRHRWIQVNDQLRTFMVREFTAAKQRPASSKAAAPDSEIAGSVEVSDTGERKDFFGYSAHRLKWKIMNQSESCGSKSTIYGDGWYTHPPVDGCYWRTLRRMFSHPGVGCKGHVVVTGPDLDRPAFAMVADTSLDEHFSMIIRDEVTSVSSAPLDSALFEVPAGYKQVDTLRELIGDQAMDAALAILANAQSGKSSEASPELAQQLQFLVGEWTYSAGMPQECTFSIAPELKGRILVWRSNVAHCSVVPPDKRYEDRTIFYVDPADGKAHALILDSEGQVLHFDVSIPEPNKVVLESGIAYDGKRYRITFSLEQGALRARYEVARPLGEYWTYMDRLSPPTKPVSNK